MSLAPIPTGQTARGKINLQPDWEINQNDYNFDVLTCRVKGTLDAILAFTPKKYTSPQGISFPPGVGAKVARLSCSARKIIGGEGLSATADLEFKGFIAERHNPIVSLTWLTASHSISIALGLAAGITLNATIPTTAQLTLKFGNTSRYDCQIGQRGVPYGAFKAPDVIPVKFGNEKLGELTVNIYALTDDWMCEKHDPVEAGIYTEETQVWTRSYAPLV